MELGRWADLLQSDHRLALIALHFPNRGLFAPVGDVFGINLSEIIEGEMVFEEASPHEKLEGEGQSAKAMLGRVI